MKFLIDEDLSPVVARYLCQELLSDAGHEVLLLREHIQIDSPDQIVIDTAQEFQSILVSLNGDFSKI
jgi:predicted nuclease of predicted toxin-antitoxin system